MAELQTIPKREWATSEEVIKLLERVLESAKRGEIVSVAYVAERREGLTESGSTKLENCWAVAGTLMSLAMRHMGFQDQGKRTTL